MCICKEGTCIETNVIISGLLKLVGLFLIFHSIIFRKLVGDNQIFYYGYKSQYWRVREKRAIGQTQSRHMVFRDRAISEKGF